MDDAARADSSPTAAVRCGQSAGGFGRQAVTAAEFFAGMGLMRAGLERCDVRTVWANDVSATKAALYRANWGDDELTVRDIRDVDGSDVPGVDVATASFPCVDLSLAGTRTGLAGSRSGLVHEFVRVLGEMRDRLPRAVVIENVPGWLSSADGQDFETVVGSLKDLGYSVAHVTIDAAAFVPQSRRRVFLTARLGEPIAVPVPPAATPPRYSGSLISPGLVTSTATGG